MPAEWVKLCPPTAPRCGIRIRLPCPTTNMSLGPPAVLRGAERFLGGTPPPMNNRAEARWKGRAVVVRGILLKDVRSTGGLNLSVATGGGNELWYDGGENGWEGSRPMTAAVGWD